MADNVIGQIALELGVNTGNFKQQLLGLTKTTKNSVGNMSGMFGKLGAAVTAALSVKAVVGFAKACIDLGSDLAEVQNVVDVTFGSMSGAVNQWAKDAMTSYGMSEKVAKEYMGQFGAMSKAFGNTEQMAYDQATALTGLAGDVASFYNMTTDEAFTKLKAVYTGETEALKSLGVVMTQAALDEYALAKGFGKTTGAMSEQEKVALRLAFVTDRLSGASGDFARTSDGWANQTRVLALRFDAIKASIGQGLINALTPAIRLLNGLMAHLQAAADAFAGFMEAIFGDAGGASAGSSLASGSEALAANMDTAADSAAAMKKSLAGFDQINMLGGSSGSGGSGAGSTGGTADNAVVSETTSSRVDKVKQGLDEIKAKLLSFASITGFTDFWNKFLAGVDNAKMGVQNLFGAFTAAVTTNIPNLEALKTSLSNAFLAISNTLTTIWGDIWVVLTENFRLWTETNFAGIQRFFENIVSIFSGYTTLISDAVGGLYEDLGTWWEANGKPVFDGIIKAIGDVWTWVLDIYNTVIAPIIQKVIDICKHLWDNTLRPLWQNILGVVSDIGDCLLAIWNNILKPVVDWIVKKFGPPVSALFQNMAQKVGDAMAIVGEKINGLITALRGVLQFITGVFSGDWKKAWTGIQTVFSGIWQVMKTEMTPIINGMLSIAEKFINRILGGLNWLIKQVNKISFDVPDWVPEIGGKKLGFNLKPVSEVSLPRLATGGYVAANTPQLAIIGDNKHEGEIVAPESKIAEAVAAGFAMVMAKMQQSTAGQNERPMYVTLKLGEDSFWEGFVDYHNSIVKRTGDSPLLV